MQYYIQYYFRSYIFTFISTITTPTSLYYRIILNRYLLYFVKAYILNLQCFTS